MPALASVIGFVSSAVFSCASTSFSSLAYKFMISTVTRKLSMQTLPLWKVAGYLLLTRVKVQGAPWDYSGLRPDLLGFQEPFRRRFPVEGL